MVLGRHPICRAADAGYLSALGRQPIWPATGAAMLASRGQYTGSCESERRRRRCRPDGQASRRRPVRHHAAIEGTHNH